MDTFLNRVANSLYAKYGDGISSLNILFPNRRARLFFSEALAGIIAGPVWEPAFPTVQQLMENYSGLRTGEQTRLVAELFKIYSRYHTEPFDSFYFWGEILISDFDAVDKYIVDAGMLFKNLSDLKEIEKDHSYLSQDQIEAISRFWQSMGGKMQFSEEKQKFMDIWRTLPFIYREYRERLDELGFGYEGMVYRAAAEKLATGSSEEVPQIYAIAGFNALTNCEKKLFDHLVKNHTVEFYWDYDNYYLEDKFHEAGLFMRENLSRYSPSDSVCPGDEFTTQEKNIEIIPAPSDSLQSRYTGEFLEQAVKSTGAIPGKETAIVLTDEDLLLPVLNSIPENIEDINVTMGYPVRMTPAYTFVERILSLYKNRRESHGKPTYLHRDVTGLLSHPYVRLMAGGDAAKLYGDIISQGQIRVPVEKLISDNNLENIFRLPGDGWQGLATSLTSVLSNVLNCIGQQPAEDKYKNKEQAAAAARYMDKAFLEFIGTNIIKITNVLLDCDIDFPENIYPTLVRRAIQRLRIPFEGEPLHGVQVMGVLETRCLDFENVLVLSMTDDNFPGNRIVSPSFIPYTLKIAYGLPTPAEEEGIAAYYFYRLLHRSRNISLAYCSRNDEKSSGERSRYIYQLQYESPHPVREKAIRVDLRTTGAVPVEVVKTNDTYSKLLSFTLDGKYSLSPTALYHYIECPLKFYFYSIARLAKQESISEEIDSPMFGTILHKAMEILYRPLVGISDPGKSIKSLIRSDKIGNAVNEAIRNEFFRGESVPEENYGGRIILIKDIIEKYINTCILPFDAVNHQFKVSELEKRITCGFPVELPGGNLEIKLSGLADRIDILPGGSIRIVDYKTGAVHLDFHGIDALFGPEPQKRNAAAFQTFLYSMIFNSTTKQDVQPSLYYVRSLNKPGYSPLLNEKSTGVKVDSYLPYKEEFERRLSELLSGIFSRGGNFSQCEDPKTCRYCDFNVICKR